MKNNNITPKIKLLTIKESAELVNGLSVYRIRELCKSGKLPCFKSGKKYLINETELLKFIGNTKGGGRDE